jgi:hypothetical protein
MLARIGDRAPNLSVSEWVQGRPTNMKYSKLIVRVASYTEFLMQLRCTNNITMTVSATAFEDFDKNNLENLKLLLTTGKVIGALVGAVKGLLNE